MSDSGLRRAIADGWTFLVIYFGPMMVGAPFVAWSLVLWPTQRRRAVLCGLVGLAVALSGVAWLGLVP